MKDFRDLAVWTRAHQVVLEVYRVTASFPRKEMYGLTAQVRRAAASICANIAEGCGRGGNAEFARFLQMAMGSASETEYHLLLARDLKLLPPAAYEQVSGRLVEVKRMLAALLRKVRADC